MASASQKTFDSVERNDSVTAEADGARRSKTVLWRLIGALLPATLVGPFSPAQRLDAMVMVSCSGLGS